VWTDRIRAVFVGAVIKKEVYHIEQWRLAQFWGVKLPVPPPSPPEYKRPTQHPELMSPNRKQPRDGGRKSTLFANLESRHFVEPCINNSSVAYFTTLSAPRSYSVGWGWFEIFGRTR
jgi:hypothetical protein